MTRHGLVMFALLSFLWGIACLLIKVAVAEVSVPFLVFARSAVGVVVLSEPLDADILAAFGLILRGSYVSTSRVRQPPSAVSAAVED